MTQRHSRPFRDEAPAHKLVEFLLAKAPELDPILTPPKDPKSGHPIWRVEYLPRPMLPAAPDQPPAHDRHWHRPEYWNTYGHWFSEQRPDFERCCVSVYPSGRGGAPHQCSNTAKFDPDWTGKPTRCNAHSRARRAGKAAAKAKRWADQEAKWARDALDRRLADEAEAIIRHIAAGHNDPRSLCLDWVNRKDAT